MLGNEETYDAPTGRCTFARQFPDGSHFMIRATFGFCLATGPGEHIVENDVVEIERIESTERRGLGMTALAILLTKACDLDVHLGRMVIINPRVVSTLSRMQDRGLIRTAFYHVDPDPTFHPECPTALFHTQVNLYAPADARDYIAARAQSEDRDELGPMECVIWF